MNKMILIIDKPNSCIECPCSNFDKQNVCEILVRPIDDETHGLDGKPEWCPLREIPQKKEERYQLCRRDSSGDWEAYGVNIDSVAIGYNQCIDDILKQ